MIYDSAEFLALKYVICDTAVATTATTEVRAKEGQTKKIIPKAYHLVVVQIIVLGICFATSQAQSTNL